METEIPTDIWDQAVRDVDSEHGYTVEFAPDPDAHRDEYRLRAEDIAAYLAWVHNETTPVSGNAR